MPIPPLGFGLAEDEIDWKNPVGFIFLQKDLSLYLNYFMEQNEKFVEKGEMNYEQKIIYI